MPRLTRRETLGQILSLQARVYELEVLASDWRAAADMAQRAVERRDRVAAAIDGLPAARPVPDLADLFEKSRVIAADVFDRPERKAVPLAGSFGGAVTALQDACLSDSNGTAVILTLDEWKAMHDR